MAPKTIMSGMVLFSSCEASKIFCKWSISSNNAFILCRNYTSSQNIHKNENYDSENSNKSTTANETFEFKNISNTNAAYDKLTGTFYNVPQEYETIHNLPSNEAAASTQQILGEIEKIREETQILAKKLDLLGMNLQHLQSNLSQSIEYWIKKNSNVLLESDQHKINQSTEMMHKNEDCHIAKVKSTLHEHQTMSERVLQEIRLIKRRVSFLAVLMAGVIFGGIAWRHVATR